MTDFDVNRLGSRLLSTRSRRNYIGVGMERDSLKEVRLRQLPGILAMFSALCVFACIQNYRTNIPDLKKLDADGERVTGTVAEFIPAQGRRAAEYSYVFSVQGRTLSGGSTDFDAVGRGNAGVPTAGDQVTIYYLPADPRINRAGSPGNELRLSYLIEVVFAALTLGFALVSMYCFRRVRAERAAASKTPPQAKSL